MLAEREFEISLSAGPRLSPSLVLVHRCPVCEGAETGEDASIENAPPSDHEKATMPTLTFSIVRRERGQRRLQCSHKDGLIFSSVFSVWFLDFSSVHECRFSFKQPSALSGAKTRH
jgi:hypothetical protein